MIESHVKEMKEGYEKDWDNLRFFFFFFFSYIYNITDKIRDRYIDQDVEYKLKC